MCSICCACFATGVVGISEGVSSGCVQGVEGRLLVNSINSTIIVVAFEGDRFELLIFFDVH